LHYGCGDPFTNTHTFLKLRSTEVAKLRLLNRVVRTIDLLTASTSRRGGVHHQGSTVMKKTTIIATAAALFAAGAIASSVNAQATNRCSGVNACKGQSECKMANSSCKGQNACKGQGWVHTGTTLECIAIGGTPQT